MSSPTQATTTTTTTSPTMDQDLFQFFDSLAHPSPVGEWFIDSASYSSSPEIATPLDVHPSPSTAPKVDPIPAYPSSTAIGVGGDLDMSDILNSPLIDSAAVMPHVDMSTNQDLPSVLAAFVAAVSTSTATTSSATTATTTSSTEPQPTMTVSPPTLTTAQKRSSEETNPSDQVALKRQKNTDAARRSRLKKVIKMESLEKRVHELERMNAQLLLRVAVLDSEKSHLQSKEASHEARIKTLEAQLADAHKALSRSS